MNDILWWFGQNTLVALLMIPCVLLACRLFRDRPAVQHLLWLVILVKFVTPPVVVWPWSVDELRSMAWSQEPAVQAEAIETAEVMVASSRQESRRQDATATFPSEFVPYSEPIAPPSLEPVVVDVVPEIHQPTTQPQWSQILGFGSLSVWFIGALVCLVGQIRRLTRYARLTRRGAIAPLHLNQEMASVASRLRMKPPVCLVVKGIASPFLWCVGAIRLAWPDSLASPVDVVRSRGIIAHELAHLRRRDHWITWLELGAGILWWWNPLFWFAQHRLRETAEMSCDALAIAANPDGRSDYAEILLQLSSRATSGIPAPVLGVGAGNARSFERRLKMILSPNVSGKLSFRGALAMAFLAVIALPYWSLAQSSTSEPDPKPTLESRATPANTPMPTNDEPAERKVPEPDSDGIYWSDREKDEWRAGMKVIQRPTAESPLLAVQNVLRNMADEARSVNLSINGRGEQSFDLSAGNFIRADIRGGSWIEDHTAGPNEVLQQDHWRATFDFTGVQPGDYSVQLGSTFFVPVDDQVGRRNGVPFRLTLPIKIPNASSSIPIAADDTDSQQVDPPYAKLAIHWGQPVSGLRIGILFPDAPENSIKRFKHGELAQAQLFIQNVTTKTVPCQVMPPHPADGWGLNIENSDSDSIRRNQSRLSHLSPMRLFYADLEAGEIQPITGKLPKFREGDEEADVNHLEFLVEQKAPEQGEYSPPFTYGLQYGLYSVRTYATLRRTDIPNANLSVSSGAIPFEVGDANVTSPGETPQPTPGPPATSVDDVDGAGDHGAFKQGSIHLPKLLATLLEHDQKFDNRSLKVEHRWDELMSPKGEAEWIRHNEIRFGASDPGTPAGLPDDYEQPHRVQYLWTQRGPEAMVERFGDIEHAVEAEHSRIEKHRLEHADPWKYLLPCGIGFGNEIQSITSTEATQDGYIIKGLLKLTTAVIEGRQNSFVIHLDRDLIIRRAELQCHVYDIVVVTTGLRQSSNAPSTAERGDFTRYFIGTKGERLGQRSGIAEHYAYKVLEVSDPLTDQQFDERVRKHPFRVSAPIGPPELPEAADPPSPVGAKKVSDNLDASTLISPPLTSPVVANRDNVEWPKDGPNTADTLRFLDGLRLEKAAIGYLATSQKPWNAWTGKDGRADLSGLPEGRHWLISEWPLSVIPVELPHKQFIQRQELRFGTPPQIDKNATWRDYPVKLTVERDEAGKEFIRVDIVNQTDKRLSFSELDLSLSSTGRGYLISGYSPLWLEDDLTKAPRIEIAARQSGSFRIDWTQWAQRGVWNTHSALPINLPSAPADPPGRIRVGLNGPEFGSKPVELTHPEMLVAMTDKTDAKKVSDNLNVSRVSAETQAKHASPKLIIQKSQPTN